MLFSQHLQVPELKKWVYTKWIFLQQTIRSQHLLFVQHAQCLNLRALLFTSKVESCRKKAAQNLRICMYNVQIHRGVTTNTSETVEGVIIIIMKLKLVADFICVGPLVPLWCLALKCGHVICFMCRCVKVGSFPGKRLATEVISGVTICACPKVLFFPEFPLGWEECWFCSELN